jgi:hypothetical protein
MTQTDIIDVSHIKFTSTVFPTDEDMKLWHSLSPAEQNAVIMRDVEQGLKGPPALKASKAEIMGEVLDELKHGI